MPGVYDIYVKDQFAAVHALRGYDGQHAKMHGHNWTVEACIQCTKLNQRGIGIDFQDVRETLGDVVGLLSHTNLNDVAEFGAINPTTENLAKFIYSELSRRLNTAHIRVKKVSVLERRGCGAAYREIE